MNPQQMAQLQALWATLQTDYAALTAAAQASTTADANAAAATAASAQADAATASANAQVAADLLALQQFMDSLEAPPATTTPVPAAPPAS